MSVELLCSVSYVRRDRDKVLHSVLVVGTIILLFYAVFSYSIPTIGAYSQIELQGFFLRDGLVDFYVDPAVTTALKDKVLLSFNIWNSAMQWHVEGYTSDKFSPLFLHLVENKDEAETLISFFISEQTNVGGYAKCISDAEGYLQRAEVHINLPPSVAADQSEIRTVAVLVHEIGHVLGLGHTDLEEDIMYSTYDENAPNYGLPSTMDLEAVYKLLRHEADPNRAFQGTVLWGIPSWVKQIPTGYELTIPTREIITQTSLSYPTTIVLTKLNQITFTMKVTNGGNVPIKIILFRVIMDDKDYFPINDFPRIVEPNSDYELTWKIEQVSQLSKFSADIEYKYLVPLMIGWKTEHQRMEGPISIVSEATTWHTEVTMPTQYVGTTFIKTETAETKFDYLPIVLLVASLAVVIIGIILVISARKK